MAELMTSIGQYWTRRAPSYTDVINKNLSDGWDQVWAEELISHFPAHDGALRVLDIGTGPGFYAIILARRGYCVTAIDYSEGMLSEAMHNAGELADSIEFLHMDAQNLEFADDSFDVIVTRNLTWNLPSPIRAYEEWRRVLRPDVPPRGSGGRVNERHKATPLIHSYLSLHYGGKHHGCLCAGHFLRRDIILVDHAVGYQIRAGLRKRLIHRLVKLDIRHVTV